MIGTGEAVTRPVPARSRAAPRAARWWGGLLALLFGGALAALAGSVGLDGVKEYIRALVCLGRPRPAPSGLFGVGSLTLPVDAGPEGGEVPVSLYYPCEPAPPGAALRLAGAREALAHPTRAGSRPGAPPAPSDAGFPLLIYFPSWFSHRHENSFMLANLASRGFVVASIDDVARLPPVRGPDRDVQQAGTDASTEAGYASARALAGRRADLEARLGSAVVTRIVGSPAWERRIDAGRIAAIGFSFGGSAAAAMSHADPRIRAVVNLDGSLFGEVADAGLKVPYLTFLAGDSFPTVAELNQPDLAARFEAILNQEAIARQETLDRGLDSWTFVVDRTSHLDFSDRLVLPAFGDHRTERDIDRLRTWRDVNGLVSDFLDVALRDGSREDFPGRARRDTLRTLEAADPAVPAADRAAAPAQ